MNVNGLISIVGILLIVGLFLWAIGALPVIDTTIKQFIKIIVIVVAGLWVIGILCGRLGFQFLR